MKIQVSLVTPVDGQYATLEYLFASWLGKDNSPF